MKLSPRAKLLLLASLFLVPIAASVVAFLFFRPEPTSNYGELLLPPAPAPAHAFAHGAGAFRFSDLGGRWVLVTSDSGACEDGCRAKLAAMRQVWLALGRNASRVARVFVIDDVREFDTNAFGELEGMVVAVTPRGMSLPTGAANDRAHIYLVDPNGNVMMRWPGNPEMRRMFRDLERLLKASQIG